MRNMRTVRELKELLAECQDDALVVLATDAEGNGFAGWDGFDHEQLWDDANGDVAFTVEMDEGDERVSLLARCVILWPDS